MDPQESVVISGQALDTAEVVSSNTLSLALEVFTRFS